MKDVTLLSFDTCIVLEFPNPEFVCYNNIQTLGTGEIFLFSISVCFCNFFLSYAIIIVVFSLLFIGDSKRKKRGEGK